MDLKFQVEHRCPETHARAGRYFATHGMVETPIFMPVGTVGSVKAVDPRDLEEAGAQIILGNTYHLGIRPGIDTLIALSGMHGMADWHHPILTDSGGFQVMSLAKIRKIDERGVQFRNHINGALLDLTPEHSIEIQEAIGSDICMVLDHLAPSTAPRAVHEAAMQRTTRWALRCLAAHKREDQALFGIIQGGIDHELRRWHVDELCQHPFDGFGIGGLSVGESIPEMYAALEVTAPRMPEDRPRYLMGVGTPNDLVEGVARGVDMFDCVMPTRNARKGGLFVDGGRRHVNIRNACYRDMRDPVDSTCDCYTCRHFSAGYLRHLLIAKELLAYRLLSIHNLRVYLRLMETIRAELRAGTFAKFLEDWRRATGSNSALNA